MLFISLPIMLYMVYVRKVSAHVRIVRVQIGHATRVAKLLNQIELFAKLRFFAIDFISLHATG